MKLYKSKCQRCGKEFEDTVVGICPACRPKEDKRIDREFNDWYGSWHEKRRYYDALS